MLTTMPTKLDSAPDSSTENGGAPANSCGKYSTETDELHPWLPESQDQRLPSSAGAFGPPVLVPGQAYQLEPPHELVDALLLLYA
jgi:hypothetical protein